MGKTKQWKSGGEEDRLIKKLILKGKVNKFTKPTYLQNEFPSVFGSFSSNVIRNHLNVLKRNAGLYLDDDNSGVENDEYPTLEEEQELLMNEGLATTASSLDLKPPNGFENFLHTNYPIICQPFIDPESEHRKVLAVLSLPGGCKNVKAELATDGLSVTIKYSWAKAMYDVKDLFKKQLAANNFNSYHPMLLSVKQGLAQVRKKMDVVPTASINIKLPFKVQTSPNSWEKWGIVRPDGTSVCMTLFTGIVDDYVVKATSEDVVFDE